MSGFSPIVHRRTSDAMALIVNLYIVETAEALVLVDGAISRSFAAGVRAEIAGMGKPLAAALLTHGHPDHYLGIGDILRDNAVPIYARPGAAAQVALRDRTERAGMQMAFGDDFPAHTRQPDRLVEAGAVLTLGGLAFELADYGPAESDSDGTWTIHDAATGIEHVFCGDLIYNHMHLFLQDGHAEAWLAALDRLAAAHPPGTRFYPGHGEPCGHELLHWNRAYIHMYLETLGTLLGPAADLDDAGKATLVATIRSFLPSNDLIQLAQFKLDETIHHLGAAARRAVAETQTGSAAVASTAVKSIA
ncbi:MAG: MBL fold metallo-hydrolase [Rhodospirillaceae bacterium]|nr:MBL fold metallo-hydrolase [Rhodospirillaceae bacterium]